MLAMIYYLSAFYYFHCTLLSGGWSAHAVGSVLQVEYSLDAVFQKMHHVCTLQLRKMLESVDKHVGLFCIARHHSSYWSKQKHSGCSLLVVADPPSIWQTLGSAAVVPGTPKCTVRLTNNGCFQFMVWRHVRAYLYLVSSTSGYYICLINVSVVAQHIISFLKP